MNENEIIDKSIGTVIRVVRVVVNGGQNNS